MQHITNHTIFWQPKFQKGLQLLLLIVAADTGHSHTVKYGVKVHHEVTTIYPIIVARDFVVLYHSIRVSGTAQSSCSARGLLVTGEREKPLGAGSYDRKGLKPYWQLLVSPK
jgi:hypothetical protein